MSDHRAFANVAARLKEAREKAGFASATEAARHFGWNENTYRSHENGERGIKPAVLGKYAFRFNIDVIWLATGRGDAIFRRNVEVVGFVRKNGIVVEREVAERHRFAELDFDIPEKGACYIVQTDAMAPRYANGDLLICWGKFERNPIGLEGFAHLDDDTTLFGLVANVTPSFELEPLGGKRRRGLGVRSFDPVRVVIRDTMYAERLTLQDESD